MNGKYVVKRIIYAILTYMVIILIYSALFNTVMDSTLETQLQEEVQTEIRAVSRQGTMDQNEIQEYRQSLLEQKYEQYHLNDPLVSRIFWRAYDALKFDFGNATILRSGAGDQEVIAIVTEALPRTVLLFTVAAFITIIIGILLGLKKAQKPGGLMDQGTSIITMIMYGMPSWWLGMIMIMFLVYAIPIFPSGGLHSTPPPQGFIAYYVDVLHHMALPVLTIVLIGFWGRAYVIRNIVLGTLQEDYIMSARARGLSEKKVLYGHTLRSSAPPIVEMAVMSLLFSFGGDIIFEGIFSWPGMGNLYWRAIQANDLPVLMGNLAVTTLIYLSGYVVMDLIYGFLDPRIKVGGKG